MKIRIAIICISVKGGKYIELLDKADVVLVDKTGTLTLGKPQITEVIPLNGLPADEALRLAATAERYSEHPLAQAVLALAHSRNLSLGEREQFETLPGLGVRVRIDGEVVEVGNRRMIPNLALPSVVSELDARGQAPMFVSHNGTLIAVLAAADTLRPEMVGATGQTHQKLARKENRKESSSAAL